MAKNACKIHRLTEGVMFCPDVGRDFDRFPFLGEHKPDRLKPAKSIWYVWSKELLVMNWVGKPLEFRKSRDGTIIGRFGDSRTCIMFDH